MQKYRRMKPSLLEWISTIFTVIGAITAIIALFVTLQQTPQVMPAETLEPTPVMIIKKDIFSVSALSISFLTILLMFLMLNGNIIYAIKLIIIYSLFCSILYFSRKELSLNIDYNKYVLYSCVIGIVFMCSILMITILSGIRSTGERGVKLKQKLTGSKAILLEDILVGEIGRIEVISNGLKYIKLAKNIGDRGYKRNEIICIDKSEGILFFK